MTAKPLWRESTTRIITSRRNKRMLTLMKMMVRYLRNHSLFSVNAWRNLSILLWGTKAKCWSTLLWGAKAPVVANNAYFALSSQTLLIRNVPSGRGAVLVSLPLIHKNGWATPTSFVPGIFYLFLFFLIIWTQVHKYIRIYLSQQVMCSTLIFMQPFCYEIRVRESLLPM